MITILAINFSLFLIFVFLGRQCKTNVWIRHIFIILFVFSATNVAYYAHFFDNFVFYYTFRTQIWADYTPSLSGLLVGYCIRIIPTFAKASILLLLVFISLIYIVGPWLKNLMLPIEYDTLPNKWRDNVSIQSMGTCGPCSLANILNYNGITSTENILAKEAFTTASGTESWYLARCARRRGFKTKFIYNINHLEKNSIIGINVGKAGHFISIVDIKNDLLFITDSLVGFQEIKINDFHQKYQFSGMALNLYDFEKTTAKNQK